MSYLLEAVDLSGGYGERPVVRGASLGVRSGEVLALVGPNGAGKTTLLRLLARLLRPSAGEVLLEGQPLWSRPPKDVARVIALAPQLEQLAWPLTVAQAVELGRAPHRGWLRPFSANDRAVCAAAMERMGVARYADRLLSELSGGERQRVVLARALAQQPRLLILDEPTAHLDLKYQTELLLLARNLAHQDGLAVVLTLHDLNHAALCADRIALLAGGELRAIGTPTEVLEPQLLRDSYGVAVHVARHPIDGTLLVTPALDGALEAV
ncbi:ABC transporter ATP-binding protein [Chloroflexia bacterium SDU3-3]|nr:ABC transporter ATP-binding protein [Chloroflexia bacterium SDU3-3]